MQHEEFKRRAGYAQKSVPRTGLLGHLRNLSFDKAHRDYYIFALQHNFFRPHGSDPNPTADKQRYCSVVNHPHFTHKLQGPFSFSKK